MPIACRNPTCLGPLTAGGAGGLCSRCYRYSRRHEGTLPASQRSGDLEAQLPPVRCSALLARHVDAAARKEGLSMAVWLRRAVEAAVLRQAGKRLRTTR